MPRYFCLPCEPDLPSLTFPEIILSSSRFQDILGLGYPLTEQMNLAECFSGTVASPEHFLSLKLGGSEN